MQALVYYLTLPLLYGFSLLPGPLLYGVSDVFYLLLYKVAGYRKGVVLMNLRNAFPDKSEAEIRGICNRFYHHFFDLILETLKTLTISKAAMLRRCAMSAQAQALFDGYAERGQSVILMLGHQGHWEWGGNTFSLSCRQQLYVIYHPLTNKFFDGLVYRMRTRFGTKLIAMRDTIREMIANKQILSATAFIADQSPQPSGARWVPFLNQDTPFFQGAEKISQKLNQPVIYVLVNKIARGRYRLDAEVLLESTKGLPEGALTDAYARRLELDILAQPHTWLWTHRRWKHRRDGELPSYPK